MTSPELPESPAQRALLTPSDAAEFAKPPLFGHHVVPNRLNTCGLTALIISVLGFAIACITGALIVGWVLLPVAFILANISFFARGKSKWMGVLALILSIVGTIVVAIVFAAVVAETARL